MAHMVGKDDLRTTAVGDATGPVRTSPGDTTSTPEQPMIEVAVGRDDHREFLGESDVDPIERLARYRPPTLNGSSPPSESGEASEKAEADPAFTIPTAAEAPEPDAGDVSTQQQTSTQTQASWRSLRNLLGQGPEGDEADEFEGPFSAVEPGSLAGVERVYVFIHGWLPGSRETADRHYAQQGDIAVAWDESIRNVVGVSMVENYEPLLAALASRDPEAAVLWFSWVDQSGTDTALFAARDSLRHTGANGRRLASALTRAIGRGSPKVHLLGHSHGSVVATHAALALPHPPSQLTILDCPEDWFSRAGGAAGLLTGLLPRLNPGRGPAGTFVDSYASFFGRSYHERPGLAEVVDVRLTPRVSRQGKADPASQAHQYAVEWYAESVSNDDFEAGFPWTPANGFDVSDLGNAYLANGDKVREISRWGIGRAGSDSPDYVTSALPHTSVELTTKQPDVLFAVTLPEDSILVEFDYDITRPGKRTALDVAVDRQVAFSAQAAHKVPARGRYVRVAGGEMLLQFRLQRPGRFTTATIDRVRVVRAADEPRNFDDTEASATFFAFGAMAGAATVVGAVVGFKILRAGARRLMRGRRGKS